MGDTLIALMGIICVFGIPLSVIWTTHQRKMVELQLRLRNEGDTTVRASVDALREEVRQLRDTSMQYDLSFDTALQRMEKRVEGLERRVNQAGTDNVLDMRLGS
jgi:hypothetical protein